MAEGKPVGRRIVLGMIGLGAVGVVVGRSLQDAEQSVLGPLQNHDPTGITQLVPAGAAFRYYSVTGSTPERTRESYRLVVGGLVQRPSMFTLDDLERMPQTSLTRDFQCVTGWRVPDVAWSGVALPDLLDVVGVSRRARALSLSSFDGTYTESLTLDQARRRDVLVATRMLDGPVTADHGGPVRTVRSADVRVQVAQMAGRYRAHRRGRSRLLGSARLRRGRVGRAFERT